MQQLLFMYYLLTPMPPAPFSRREDRVLGAQNRRRVSGCPLPQVTARLLGSSPLLPLPPHTSPSSLLGLVPT